MRQRQRGLSLERSLSETAISSGPMLAQLIRAELHTPNAPLNHVAPRRSRNNALWGTWAEQAIVEDHLRSLVAKVSNVTVNARRRTGSESVEQQQMRDRMLSRSFGKSPETLRKTASAILDEAPTEGSCSLAPAASAIIVASHSPLPGSKPPMMSPMPHTGPAAMQRGGGAAFMTPALQTPARRTCYAPPSTAPASGTPISNASDDWTGGRQSPNEVRSTAAAPAVPYIPKPKPVVRLQVVGGLRSDAELRAKARDALISTETLSHGSMQRRDIGPASRIEHPLLSPRRDDKSSLNAPRLGRRSANSKKAAAKEAGAEVATREGEAWSVDDPLGSVILPFGPSFGLRYHEQVKARADAQASTAAAAAGPSRSRRAAKGSAASAPMWQVAMPMAPPLEVPERACVAPSS